MGLEFMGKKEGMTRLFDQEGNLVVCTVISLQPAIAVQNKNLEKDGYHAVQLGAVKVAESKKRKVCQTTTRTFRRRKSRTDALPI